MRLVSALSALKYFQSSDGSGIFVEARGVVFTAVCALVDVQNLSLRLADAVVPDAIHIVKGLGRVGRYMSTFERR